MKWIALIIGSLLCLLEVAVVFAYFEIFGGGLSLNNQDWDTFCQVLNGCVMAILTGLNIWLFYKISNSIEKNTSDRAAKQSLFEAQLVITQIRVKQYDELSLLINDIIVDLCQKNIDEDKIEQLKKKLMRIDQSFLFKKDNLGDNSFLFLSSKEILLLIEERKDGYMDKLANKLIDFVGIMEMHIFAQMMRGRDVIEYMNNHKGYIDSTFSHIDQLVHKLSESANKSSSNQ